MRDNKLGDYDIWYKNVKIVDMKQEKALLQTNAVGDVVVNYNVILGNTL